MIEDVWKRMSADPSAKGCSLKLIEPPAPNADSMKKCRELCAQNLCGQYGVTWGCPPGIGTGEKCLKAVGKFSHAAVLIKEYNNVNVKDRKLMEKLAADHQDSCRKFKNELVKEGYRVLVLTDGGCKYCGKCSYPDEPCRFPEQMMTSISAYGIMMGEYMKANNIEFEFRDDSMTLYGLVLY